MRKLFILFSLITVLAQAQGVKRRDCITVDYTDSITKQHKYVVISCDSVIVPINYDGFLNDLRLSPLFQFAADSAKPNYFSSTMQCFNSKPNPQVFLMLLQMCKIPFNAQQKQEFNEMARKNGFDIKLQ